MTDKQTYQMLMLIATPKLADKAAAMFSKNNLPLQFRLSAEGTASSEIMDTLGFGSVDKSVLMSYVPQELGKRMLQALHTQLRLDAVNSGIAFTISLTAASNLMVRMMNSASEHYQDSDKRKGDFTMGDTKYTLIAATVDRGFGSVAMDAARAAGAGGGTIVHSRGIENQEATGFWGLSVQEEKEIVLILAEHESKVAIMKAISEQCGMQTEAKGLVVSLPIDAVMGI